MVFNLSKYGIVVLARNSLSIGIVLEDWLVKIHDFCGKSGGYAIFSPVAA